MINDTVRPDGLMLILLVFNTYPWMIKLSPLVPSLIIRAAIVNKVMTKVQRLRAKTQVANMLAKRNGPNTLETLNLLVSIKVRVYRETRGWIGLYVLLAKNGETCIVKINGKATNFQIVIMKPYY